MENLFPYPETKYEPSNKLNLYMRQIDGAEFVNGAQTREQVQI